LHDDKVDKINRRGFGEACGDVVRLEIIGEVAVLEPQTRERNPRTLEIPIRHGEGGGRFEDADEPIRLQYEAPVDEPIYLRLARATQEDIGFWGFIGQNGGSGAVREAAA
jgi:hypothetical protein